MSSLLVIGKSKPLTQQIINFCINSCVWNGRTVSKKVLSNQQHRMYSIETPISSSNPLIVILNENSNRTYNKMPRNLKPHLPLFIVGLTILGISANYFFSNNDINNKEIDDAGMRRLINNLARRGDKEKIKALIANLQDVTFYPNIDNGHLWEIDIRDSLIYHYKLQLIKEIFPLFREQTLSSFSDIIYYKPIEGGDLNLVKALVEGGLKAFVSEKERYSKGDVLLYSIFLKQREIMEYLLKNAKYDVNKAYPFSIRYVNKTERFGEYVAEDSITPSYLAVLMNEPDLLRQLKELGADFNQPNTIPKSVDKDRIADHYFDNPLIGSIIKGYEECFSTIVESEGINLNFRGHDFKTPLMVAVLEKKFTMAQTLIAKGADVNIFDSFNLNAMRFAIYGGDMPTIKALQKAGANLRHVDDSKTNLWHIAVYSKNMEEVCTFLRESGIQDIINDEDKYGETPLCKAILMKDSNSFRALLISGANPKQILKKLSNSTLKSYNLSNSVTIKKITVACKKKYEHFLIKEKSTLDSDEVKTIKNYIDELEKIINLLKNPPNPIISQVNDASKQDPQALKIITVKLNNVDLNMGTSEELESKFKQSGGYLNGDFLRQFSTQLAGATFTPPKLLVTLMRAIRKYGEIVGDGTVDQIMMDVPQLLCAFSDDLKMQRHLRRMWEMYMENPKEFKKFIF